MSSRVIASAISSCCSGSNQTRFFPTSRTSAASRRCALRSLILVHLDFDVGRVEHPDSVVFGLLLDALAFATADRGADPHGVGVAVDTLQIVGVLDADLLE